MPTEPPLASIIQRLAERGPLQRLDILSYTGDEQADALDLARTFATQVEHLSLSVTCWGVAMNGMRYTFHSAATSAQRAVI